MQKKRPLKLTKKKSSRASVKKAPERSLSEDEINRIAVKAHERFF
jgi:hypothetical protein